MIMALQRQQNAPISATVAPPNPILRLKLKSVSDQGVQTSPVRPAGKRSLSIDMDDKSIVLSTEGLSAQTPGNSVGESLSDSLNSSSNTPAEVVLVTQRTAGPWDEPTTPLAVSYTVTGDPVSTGRRRTRYTTFSWTAAPHQHAGYESPLGPAGLTAPGSPVRNSPANATSVGIVAGTRVTSYRVFDHAGIQAAIQEQQAAAAGRQPATPPKPISSYKRLHVWRQTPGSPTVRPWLSPSSSSSSEAPGSPLSPGSPLKLPPSQQPMLRSKARTDSCCS